VQRGALLVCQLRTLWANSVKEPFYIPGALRWSGVILVLDWRHTAKFRPTERELRKKISIPSLSYVPAMLAIPASASLASFHSDPAIEPESST
jgi:hypothetical protein